MYYNEAQNQIYRLTPLVLMDCLIKNWLTLTLLLALILPILP